MHLLVTVFIFFFFYLTTSNCEECSTFSDYGYEGDLYDDIKTSISFDLEDKMLFYIETPKFRDQFYLVSREEDLTGQNASAFHKQLNFETVTNYSFKMATLAILNDTCNFQNSLTQSKCIPYTPSEEKEYECTIRYTQEAQIPTQFLTPLYNERFLYSFSKSVKGELPLQYNRNPILDVYYVKKYVLLFSYFLTKHDEILQSSYEHVIFSTDEVNEYSTTILAKHRHSETVEIDEYLSLLLEENNFPYTPTKEMSFILKKEIIKEEYYTVTKFVIDKVNPFDDLMDFRYNVKDTDSNNLLESGIIEIERKTNGFSYVSNKDIIVEPTFSPVSESTVSLGNFTKDERDIDHFGEVAVSFTLDQTDIKLLRKSSSQSHQYSEYQIQRSHFIIKNPVITLEEQVFWGNSELENNNTESEPFTYETEYISCSKCGIEFQYDTITNFTFVGYHPKKKFKPFAYSVYYTFEIELYSQYSLINTFTVKYLDFNVNFSPKVIVELGSSSTPDPDKPNPWPIIIIVTSIAFVGTSFAGILVGSGITGTLMVRNSMVKKFEDDELGAGNDPSIKVPLAFGKYVKTKEGKFYQVLDVSYKLINKEIKLSKRNAEMFKKSYDDILKSIRPSKYSLYAHCKQCFLEQVRCNGEKKFGENTKHFCCKCGLPLMPYIEFKTDEMFCIVCALNFRYDHKNHGRCLLHCKHKKKVGDYYFLYKTEYSVSAASKKKRDSPSLKRLNVIITTNVWKINSIMRYEYLRLLRRIIGKELFLPYVKADTITDIKLTIMDFKKREKEIINHDYSKFKNIVSTNIEELLKDKKKEFEERMLLVIRRTIVVLTRQVGLIQLMQKKIKESRKRTSNMQISSRISSNNPCVGQKRSIEMVNIEIGDNERERKKRKIIRTDSDEIKSSDSSGNLIINSPNSETSNTPTTGSTSEAQKRNDESEMSYELQELPKEQLDEPTFSDILTGIDLENDDIFSTSAFDQYYNAKNDFPMFKEIQMDGLEEDLNPTNFNVNNYIQEEMFDADVFHFDDGDFI